MLLIRNVGPECLSHTSRPPLRKGKARDPAQVFCPPKPRPALTAWMRLQGGGDRKAQKPGLRSGGRRGLVPGSPSSRLP